MCVASTVLWTSYAGPFGLWLEIILKGKTNRLFNHVDTCCPIPCTTLQSLLASTGIISSSSSHCSCSCGSNECCQVILPFSKLPLTTLTSYVFTGFCLAPSYLRLVCLHTQLLARHMLVQNLKLQQMSTQPCDYRVYPKTPIPLN